MSCIQPEIKSRLGLVHVYTGCGKGKTTASLGLAFRAAGRGLEVLMIQFLKPPENYGEHISAERFPNFTIFPMGLDHMVSEVPREKDIAVARETLARAKDEIYSGKYDLVILDEINVAVDWKLLDSDEVIDMLRGRPKNIEIVLTGRGASREIIDYADLVTEMLMVKHPFDCGISARKGIEY
ncbi:MAG: cob(I)yrinic acid a,c-diamide adenosyltransferase [Candidatus Methanoplasma sp.]|jgi:cob(I)alamin adenosyltransferase|nr:cob(I)yrinic acid a,c-diamide adenosyltransferase [Candidatus Methanoplasma sp.]